MKESSLTACLLYSNGDAQRNLSELNGLWKSLNAEFLKRDPENTLDVVQGEVVRGKEYGWSNLAFEGVELTPPQGKSSLDIGYRSPAKDLKSPQLSLLVRRYFDYSGIAESGEGREVYQIKGSESSVVVRDQSWADYLEGALWAESVVLVKGLDKARYDSLLEFSKDQKKKERAITKRLSKAQVKKK